MLSAAIAYQVLQQENPQTIDKVKAVLEKHPWYANQWQARLQDVPVIDHDLVLFMQAARWPDDIRRQDRTKIASAIPFAPHRSRSSLAPSVSSAPLRARENIRSHLSAVCEVIRDAGIFT